jgi:Putative Actinobacterial Holin-X, holin superfamily III
MARPADHIREERVATPAAVKEERSLGELFAELSRETSTLVRQEVDLAKSELTHKASEVGKDVGFLAAGALVAYAGLLALIATLVIALIQLGWTPWIAALIVGLVVTGAGAWLVWTGISALRTEGIAPRQTIETLREDAQWAKEQKG